MPILPQQLDMLNKISWGNFSRTYPTKASSSQANGTFPRRSLRAWNDVDLVHLACEDANVYAYVEVLCSLYYSDCGCPVVFPCVLCLADGVRELVASLVVFFLSSSSGWQL